jgi:autotransporter-associated beta strand protein
VISGTTALSINATGAGWVSLTGNNTFTGAVTLTQGTLNLGGASGNELGPVATSGTLTLNGGSLRFGTYTAYTVGAIAGTSNLTLSNNSNAAVTLTVGNSKNLSSTYSGNLSGAGGFNKLTIKLCQ